MRKPLLRTFPLQVATAALALVVWSPEPVAAHAPAAAVCSFSVQVALTPGLSMEPGSGSIASTQPGTMSCHGVIALVPVAGSGAVELDGTYGPEDTCLTGSAELSLDGTTTPAAGGVMAVSGSFDLDRAAMAGRGGGTFGGADASVVLGVQPDAGQDCVQTGVTSATVTGTMLLSAA